MSSNNIDKLSLGNLLQIVFDNEIYKQMTIDYRDFEMVQKMKVSGSLPREYRYFLVKNAGPGAIGYRDPGTSGRSFPAGAQSSTAEATSQLKELVATIELEYNLFMRAMKTPEKYGSPLELEIANKSSYMKRRIACDLYGDGTGALGAIASATGTTTSVVTLSTTDANGFLHAGNFEIGDLLVHRANSGGAGTTVTLASGTFAQWSVVDRDPALQTVTLQAVDTTGANQSVSSWTPTAGEILYKATQPSFQDRTSVADYGYATNVLVGLETWAQNDGRTVNGVAMSGVLAGTRYSGSANPIDVKVLQRGLDTVKINVGQDRYRYSKMIMSPSTQSAMIDSRESDRRFMAISDKKRGIEGSFGYAHGNSVLEAVTSEYCGQKRIYCIPEMKNGSKVMQYIGSDFETVKAPGGSDFHLKPASGGSYVGNIISFVQGTGALICTHPRSILCVNNFTNA